MSERTDVYLITGFLGAGKTTLLNRVIAQFPEDRKLMILMNEFGEVGVDGTLVESEDLEMMEISKGSIFCACVKTDFVKGLYAIANDIRPDVLLIESTGVANPSDLKRDLKLPIFKNRFSFREQFCVIDAAHFLDAYGAFESVEKQLATSTLFIINKVDQADRDTIRRIREVVEKHHPNPVFYETVYADFDFSAVFFPEKKEKEEPPVETVSEKKMTEEELDEYVEKLLSDPTAQVSPPERMLSAVYRWKGKDLERFKKLAERIPKTVVRSKGFIDNGERTLLFSYVMGDWELIPQDMPPDQVNQKDLIVFIGPPEAMEDLERLLPESEMSSASGLTQ